MIDSVRRKAGTMFSDEMSDTDFDRYEARVKRVAQMRGFVLTPAPSPRRYVCSSDRPCPLFLHPVQSLEQIESALRHYLEVRPWPGDRWEQHP
jgi:hypothetical protein